MSSAFITVYSGSPNPSGNASPVATIKRTNTKLAEFGYVLAVGATGKIYVAYAYGFGKVIVYAAGANGNVAPIAAIAGPKTGLDDPVTIAVDAAGRIYVGNNGPTFNECWSLLRARTGTCIRSRRSAAHTPAFSTILT